MADQEQVKLVFEGVFGVGVPGLGFAALGPEVLDGVGTLQFERGML